jgi:hypothetical protein
MKWKKWTGIIACAVIIASCFLNWAWYPDIEKYFTGFFSENNYYGKPGILLCFVAVLGMALHGIQKSWAYRTNLIFSAIGMAYGVTTFLRYSSSYDGYVPEKQFGIYLMLVASAVHLVISAWKSGLREVQVPRNENK